MVVCCMHPHVDGYEVLRGEAELLHDLQTRQAALAASVGHCTNKGLLLSYSEMEAKMIVVLPSNAHLQPHVRLGLSCFLNHSFVTFSKT